MKICIVDYYDSFTYNLFHYLEGMGHEVVVISDAAVNIDALEQFDGIVLSPGPGLPKESKSMMAIIGRYHSHKIILGVCLGMQGIGEFFGGELYNLNKVKHGIQEEIQIKEFGLFEGMGTSLKVGLYHSWALRLNAESQLKALAHSSENVLMAIQHTSLPIYGMQFHPESILTEKGKVLLERIF